MKTRPSAKASALERTFAFNWDALGGQPLVTEHQFHPTRNWRFDFAHLQTKVAIEIEGGHWSGGRHTRGAGFEKDCEKYLAAAVQGWVVIRLTGRMAKTATVIEAISELIRQRQGRIP